MTTDTIIAIVILIAIHCCLFYAYYRLLNPKQIIYPESKITTEMIVAALRRQSKNLADDARAESYFHRRMMEIDSARIRKQIETWRPK